MSDLSETATLVHGYTMADIERCQRVAVKRHTRSFHLDLTDREAAAWHGIVVELYSCGCGGGHNPDACIPREVAPTFHELLFAAYDELDKEVTATRHHDGFGPIDSARPASRPVGATGGASAVDPHKAPRFKQYWLPVKTTRTDGFSDQICDRLALADALGVLTGEQYEAIATLAAFDNAAGPAAEALGLKYHCFYYRVLSGRDKVKAVWFDDETAPESRLSAETCAAGHSRAEHGYKSSSTGFWQCRVCRRNGSRRRAATGDRGGDFDGKHQAA